MSVPANIVGAYQAIRVRLLEEFPDIDEETLADTLDGLHGAQDIIASLIRHSLEDKAAVAGLQQLESDYAKRRRRFSARAEARREAAFDLMQALNLRKVERPEFTLSVSPGKPAVIISDQATIPQQYFRVKREPDKAAIAKALEAGERIIGASFCNAAERLTVRVKWP